MIVKELDQRVGAEKQRDERGHGKSAYLCITERLPQRPSFKGQWEEGQDGG